MCDGSPRVSGRFVTSKGCACGTERALTYVERHKALCTGVEDRLALMLPRRAKSKLNNFCRRMIPRYTIARLLLDVAVTGSGFYTLASWICQRCYSSFRQPGGAIFHGSAAKARDPATAAGLRRNREQRAATMTAAERSASGQGEVGTRERNRPELGRACLGLCCAARVHGTRALFRQFVYCLPFGGRVTQLRRLAAAARHAGWCCSLIPAASPTQARQRPVSAQRDAFVCLWGRWGVSHHAGLDRSRSYRSARLSCVLPERPEGGCAALVPCVSVDDTSS